MKRTMVPVALVASLAFAAPLAHGQAQGDAKKEAKEERRQERGKDKDKDKDKGSSAAESTDAATPGQARDLPKPTDTKKDRETRRRRAIMHTRARWGALVLDAAAQAELRLHARRVARLDAMERVARASGKDALLPRIARLREKEDARFEKRMDWVKDGKDGG